jgi:mannose-6-phosphate isomerase-like protein (cupin superfamily)
MRTRDLARAAIEFAPDGSEIRRLLALQGGSFAHCTLRPGQISRAIRHRSVGELWFVLRGRGQLWRRRRAAEQVVELAPGLCASIPRGVHFQFRNTGRRPLELILCTIPPWPGAAEAVRVAGQWLPRRGLRRPRRR